MNKEKNIKGKKVLVGITGGIAVYKVATLVNTFIKLGADVKIIMTESATKFVNPLTFQTLLNDNVYVDMWNAKDRNSVEHISLAKWADVFVLAPATANTIGKIANGIADNLLTTVIMALPKHINIILAPAMNVEMWSNKIVQDNISKLKKIDKKYIFIEPRSGILACRDEGIGKLADVDDIINTTSLYC